MRMETKILPPGKLYDQPPSNQSSYPSHYTADQVGRVRLIVVVEGVNDVEFLKRISTKLHLEDSEIPDLGAMEDQGALLFIPFGGGNMRSWTSRFACLGYPEFHLYDRELSPVTEERRAAAKQVNRRDGCVALITSKREMENYLHPQALWEAKGVKIEFGDHDEVAELAARFCYYRCGGKKSWERIDLRKRKKMKGIAKRWLNSEAVAKMTPRLLSERDPVKEVEGWLETIGHLVNGSDPNPDFPDGIGLPFS